MSEKILKSPLQSLKTCESSQFSDVFMEVETFVTSFEALLGGKSLGMNWISKYEKSYTHILFQLLLEVGTQYLLDLLSVQSISLARNHI